MRSIMINESKKMLVVQSEEKADNYIYCDEYRNMNPTDIDVISIEESQKFHFSNGQHPIKPSIGKTYIQNPYNPQEYVEMTDHILKDFETSRKNKYFELAHLLGATKIEYAEKCETKEKATKNYNANQVQAFMEQVGLTVSSFSFTKEYEKPEHYGEEQYNRAKKFVEDNNLMHDGDFVALLSDRDPSTGKLKNSDYVYTFRKEVSSIFNLALNFDGVAKAIGMSAPLSCLFPSQIDRKQAREMMVSKDVRLKMSFVDIDKGVC